MYQQQQAPPQVPGLNGPYFDQNMGYFYVDSRTGNRIPAGSVNTGHGTPGNVMHNQPPGYRPPPPQPAYGGYASPHPAQQQQYASPQGNSGLYQPTGHNNTAPIRNGMYGTMTQHQYPNANRAETEPTPVSVDVVETAIVNDDELVVVDETLYAGTLPAVNSPIAHDRRTHHIVPMMDGTRKLVNVIINKAFEMNKNDHILPTYTDEVNVVAELQNDTDALVDNASVVKGDFPIKEANAVAVEANTINEATIALRGMCDVEGSCMSIFDIDHYMTALNASMPTVQHWAESKDWLSTYLTNYDKLKAESPAFIFKLDKRLKFLVNVTLREVMGLSVQIGDCYHTDKDDLMAYLDSIGSAADFTKVLEQVLGSNIKPFVGELKVGSETVDVVGYTESVAMYIADIEDTTHLEPGQITYEFTPKLFGAVTALNALLFEKGHTNPISYIVAENSGMVAYAMAKAKTPTLAKSTLLQVF